MKLQWIARPMLGALFVANFYLIHREPFNFSLVPERQAPVFIPPPAPPTLAIPAQLLLATVQGTLTTTSTPPW